MTNPLIPIINPKTPFSSSIKRSVNEALKDMEHKKLAVRLELDNDGFNVKASYKIKNLDTGAYFEREHNGTIGYGGFIEWSF